MDTFVLKKILSTLLTVIPMGVISIFLGLLIQKRKPVIGMMIVAGVAITFFCLSTPYFSNLLVAKLERDATTIRSIPQDVDYIAVLSGGRGERLIEAVRLWNTSPQTLFLTTSHLSKSQSKRTRSFYAYYASGIGVNESKITVLASARDTEAEISEIKKHVNQKKVLIVSSALHLPRVAKIARSKKLNFTLSAADRKVSNERWWQVSAKRFLASDQAIHEYLGVAWFTIKNASLTAMIN